MFPCVIAIINPDKRRYVRFTIQSIEYKEDIVNASIELKLEGFGSDVSVNMSHLCNIIRKTTFTGKDKNGRLFTVKIIDNNTYQYASDAMLYLSSKQSSKVNLRVECENGPKYIKNGSIAGSLEQTMEHEYKIDDYCIVHTKSSNQNLVKTSGSGSVKIQIATK